VLTIAPLMAIPVGYAMGYLGWPAGAVAGRARRVGCSAVRPVDVPSWPQTPRTWPCSGGWPRRPTTSVSWPYRARSARTRTGPGGHAMSATRWPRCPGHFCLAGV